MAGVAAEGGKYRGFTIDETQVRDLPNLAEIRQVVQEQIDIVCAVGLSPETLRFFQGVPFVFLPATAVRAASPGLYSRVRSAVLK